MRKAGDILSAFFDERLSKEGQKYDSLFKSWYQIAGEQLAAHSRIAELERNILVIEADHPGWIMILQSREKELLERVRRAFPDFLISGLSIRLSKSRIDGTTTIVPKPESKTIPDSQIHTEPEEDEVRTTEDVYQKIEDPHFKELLQRLEKSIRSKYK